MAKITLIDNPQLEISGKVIKTGGNYCWINIGKNNIDAGTRFHIDGENDIYTVIEVTGDIHQGYVVKAEKTRSRNKHRNVQFIPHQDTSGNGGPGPDGDETNADTIIGK